MRDKAMRRFDRNEFALQPSPPAPPPAPPNPQGSWVDLRDPRAVFQGMVPSRTRVDNARIGTPGAAQVGRCLPDNPDRRKPIYGSLKVPFRWICKLQVVALDANGNRAYSEGSGILIGDRFVLTSAHVLLSDVTAPNGTVTRTDADAVVVIPALAGSRSGARSMPLGFVTGTRIRTHRDFRRSFLQGWPTPSSLDFGLVELAEPIGEKRFPALGNNRLGFWGSRRRGRGTVIRPLSRQVLKKVKLNVVGYPTDKCRDRPQMGSIDDPTLAACTASDWASMQWWSFDRVDDVGDFDGFQRMDIAHALAPGMSGGPVWLRWRGRRNLAGIVQSCEPGDNSTAVRITQTLQDEVQRWIADA